MKRINHLLLCTVFICTTITPKETTIFQEVRAGDKEAIRKRIENYEDCSKKEDGSGNNALHIAAEEGKTEIIEMLTTEADYSGLINWGYYTFWQSPATLPDKNQKNKSGNAPVHCAIEKNHIETAERLIDKGVNVELVNGNGLSPASLMVDKDNPDWIPFLEKYNLIYQKKDNGDNHLHTAIKTNKQHIAAKLAEVPALVDAQNNEKKTPAIVATEVAGTHMLEILYKKNVDLNAPGDKGFRPIHNAARHGHYDALKFLLEHKILVDTVDSNGNTPLHYSVAENQETAMNLLLAYKADITRRNKNGADVFALAVENKHHDLIKRFKEHPNVNIDGRDKSGRTAFVRATIARNHEAMNNLITCGVNTRIGDNTIENALHKAAKNGDLIAAKIILATDAKLLSDSNKNNDSPLFTAIQYGHFDLAKLFIVNGAPLITKNGDTPAHTAAVTGTVNALRNCWQYDHLMFFERNKDNLTPFLSAAKHGNIESVDFLLGDTEFINKDFKIALNIAYENNDNALRTILEKRDIQRKSANKFIVDKGMTHRDLVSKNYQVKDLLRQEGVIVTYTPTILNRQYSEEELYLMLEEKRKKILHHYEECINKEISNNKILLNLLKKAENERIAAQVAQQAEYIRAQIQLEHARAEEQRRIFAEQERARVEEQRKINEQLETNRRTFAEQEAEIKRCNEQKKAEDFNRAQQAEYKRITEEDAAKKAQAIKDEQARLDHFAAAKAVKDAAEQRAREQQHAQALEKQQPHVPFDLKPSVPPTDQPAATFQCTACKKTFSFKLLRCTLCKKSMCKACVNPPKGQCAACWQAVGQFTQKEKGECFINTVGCTEEQGVTPIPSDCCKINSDRVCKACLNERIEKDKKVGEANRCPFCLSKGKLNKKIVETILKQK